MNKSIVVALLACAFSSGVSAQGSSLVSYAQGIKAETLSKHLHVLAHDSLDGRETGKSGQKKAARYLVNYFESIGCFKAPGMTSYEQQFDVIESTPGGDLTVNGKALTFKTDFIYYGCKAKSSYDLPVYTEQQLDLNKDKPCLVAYTLRTNDMRSEITSLKSRLPKHVEGLVVISKNYEQLYEYLDHYVTGKTMRLADGTAKKEFPIVVVRAAALLPQLSKEYTYLAGKGKAKKKISDKAVFMVKAELNTNEVLLTSSNILAYIPGSNPKLKNEVVIITAHYDHIGVEDGVVYNGADDDGTGTVALMSLAAQFMQAYKEGHGPDRSILIMPVSGEEKGLLGSSYYSQHPIIPLSNTVADLNIDMIGRNDIAHEKDTNYIYIIGSNMISQELHQVNEMANKTYTHLNLDYKFNSLTDPNQFYYRSDHYNFAKNGIPVIFYFSGVHEDYHQPTDDVEKIIFSKVELVTRLVYYTACELATRKNRLSVDY